MNTYDHGGYPDGLTGQRPALDLAGSKMRSTEEFLADARAISDVQPHELTEGDYFAINKHNGQQCIVRISGESPQLDVYCRQFIARDRVSDFRFLERVPTWGRFSELRDARSAF